MPQSIEEKIMTHETICFTNVEVGDRLGAARVFEDEDQADRALDWYPGGHLICCGGYYNAVFIPYP
jgi:hypothetical protein